MKSTAPFDGSTNMPMPTALAKGMSSAGDPCPQRLVDAFEMQIGNARMMLAHEGDHVAAAIGVMTGIQHDGDQIRIGRVQKLLDLVFIFDMGLGMGVKNQFAGHNPARAMRATRWVVSTSLAKAASSRRAGAICSPVNRLV